ncbi:NAD-dependent epimerase/dehydratase family protein [Streptomyces sp. SID11385]|uniref:NAD-dependent epimerase/dehydratase family protein n=1 Tax=Streptomyces sp. SID11385 TaxID=2706031 RepID=UPI0013C9C573|nr:NAD-dependent epimerase/dehydratase family protein [Streptomyces sp. SID11385]NEA38663.1 NAD-dependent epimerase/dehydratase family protein [Streptomyces sp. SID11385]
MRALVLGGTAFVGRAIVDALVGDGAEVTLFGRGRTGRELFPGVRRLVGDRDTGAYAALTAAARERPFDVVVDVSGYVSRQVRGAIAALDAAGGHAGRYVFVSTQAVYEAGGHPRRKAPRRDVDDVARLDNSTYGPAKVACEDVVTARFGERATLVRPGQVVGPHDTSGAFLYWLRHAERGGPTALPGDTAQPVQLLDARDLGRLVAALAHKDLGGAFDAVGPAEPLTLAALLAACARGAGTRAWLVPVADRPAYFPFVRDDWAGQRRDPGPARAAGLTATPFAETVAAVRDWDAGRGRPVLEAGLGYTAEREAELLAAGDAPGR